MRRDIPLAAFRSPPDAALRASSLIKTAPPALYNIFTWQGLKQYRFLTRGAQTKGAIAKTCAARHGLSLNASEFPGVVP